MSVWIIRDKDFNLNQDLNHVGKKWLVNWLIFYLNLNFNKYFIVLHFPEKCMFKTIGFVSEWIIYDKDFDLNHVGKYWFIDI